MLIIPERTIGKVKFPDTFCLLLGADYNSVHRYYEHELVYE